VIDGLTTQEAAGPIGEDTSAGLIRAILTDRLGAHVALYGTVWKTNQTVRANITCFDLRKNDAPLWSKEFRSDDAQRARAILAGQIVEAVIGKALWRPPEYGDEAEPSREDLGRAINVNGTFAVGDAGWDAPDNVSTFLLPGPGGRGTVLRVRTNLDRDAWLAYRKALLAGQSDPNHPPHIETDTSHQSLAGLEGVHYCSDWIPASPGRRYWLLADCLGPSSVDEYSAKVFVKGFRRMPHASDGLSESALAERSLTPRQFAALPEAKQKELIADDVRKHPMRYVRECYRWYLSCRGRGGEWMHFAAPVPPRGGLPDNVEYLQIQIYSYWPPGEYLWDDVLLFPDPRQSAPLPAEPARTPNVSP